MLNVVRSTGYRMESISKNRTDAGQPGNNYCSDIDKR